MHYFVALTKTLNTHIHFGQPSRYLNVALIALIDIFLICVWLLHQIDLE